MQGDKPPSRASKSIWLGAALFAMVVALAAPVIQAWRRHRRRAHRPVTMPASLAAPAALPQQTLPPLPRDEVKPRPRLWREALKTDRSQLWRILVSLVCVAVTATMGYTYALNIRVEGWQFWVWVASVAVVVFALMPSDRPRLRLDKSLLWLAPLTLAALLLRATSLETIPGGLHVDEYGVAGFALQHVFPASSGTHNPFITGPASHPALYHYLIRISLAVFGNTITGLRISSALAGTMAVAATYAAVSLLHDRRTALFAAAIMTAYHGHVHWSRLGLNNIWDTVWVPAMLAAFVWGWQQRWSGGAVLAGLAMGLSQYFYPGSRIGILLLVFVIFSLWRQGADRRQLLVHTGKMLVTAACVAAPLAMFALRDPTNFLLRTREVFAWQPEAIMILTHGQPDLPAFFWHQLTRSLGAFTTYPDNAGFYAPGVPLLIGLAVPLFVIGSARSIWTRRSWGVPVLWIVLTAFLGGFLLADPPSSSHYVVAIPAICWLVAMPLSWLVENGRRPWAVIALLAIVATDLVFYFAVYVPGHPRDLILPFPPLPLS
ncbi:MAG TPA: glycosyltransferase family 39 protein [Anaerolineae bacterium]|nr:glycosyltransferase family 39 protein [Anaerolineae bacterium]